MHLASIQRGDGHPEIGRVSGGGGDFQRVGAGLQCNQLVAEKFLCVHGDQGIRVGAGGLHPQLEGLAGDKIGGVGEQAQLRILVAAGGAERGFHRDVVALLVLAG